MLHLFSRYFLFFALTVWPFGGSRTQIPPEKVTFDLPENPELYQTVRIALMKNADQIWIESKEPFRIYDRDGRLLLSGQSMGKTEILAREQMLHIGPQIFRNQPITIESLGEGIRLGDRFYGDSLVVWVTPFGKLDVINELAVESYLRGVLPSEVHPDWPLETLKAQAVAARSYALFQMIKNKNSKFDMSKDVTSQVYGGKLSEKKRTDQAVSETRGQILTFRGQVLSAYYHAACGGTTTRADFIWNVQMHPALEGVRCDFCRGTKHDRWTAEFTFREIETKLIGKGWKVSGLRGLHAPKRDASGRVLEFIIEDQNGKTAIPSNDFRMALDPFRFKSTLLDDMQAQGESVLFKGRGWGHGVGFCQWGAKQLGDLGYRYKQILNYYYPETDVVQYYRS